MKPNKKNTHKVQQTHIICQQYTQDIQFTKIHIRKQQQVNKVLYIVSNIFPHHIAHTLLIPVLRFSLLYHPCITFPLHPTFTPSLCCTSSHFPSLYFTSLNFFTFLDVFHFTFLHFTSLLNYFPRTLFLTHLNNRFPYSLLQSICFAGESS